MSETIQLRRDTAANWTSVNPTLAQGELGVELDTGKVKVGNGVTAWSSLAYLAGGSGGAVSSVAAADASVVVTPTTGSVTVATGTLDAVATAHPPAASVPMNSHKITGLANGSASSDAAAFGQIPAALPPNGSAGGDLSGTFPAPTIAKLQGTTLAAPPGGSTEFLRGDGTWAVPPGTGGGGAVSSVFTRTGAVVATSGDYAVGQVTGAAPLASPALTGTPTAPTATALTDTTQVATTAYADAAVGVETARAETAEALKAPLASPALTGSPTAPTQTPGDNTTKIATDAFVTAAVAVETGRAETAEALALQKASNLSDLANSGTARTNLGLGSAATQASSAFDASGAAATAQANAEAASLALTGGTMSGAIAMGSHKITGLTNGSSAQDAAAFGQIPAALPPNGSAGGVLSGTYPNPGFATTPMPESGGTMTGWFAPAVVALTDASTVSVNAASGNVFTLLTTSGIGSTRAIGAPSNPVDGQIIRFRITQAASGGPYAATWNAVFDFGSGSAPSLTSTASKTDILAFEYVATNSLNKWCYLGAAIPQGF